MVPKLTFQLNLVPKLTLGAEVHRLVPQLIYAEVTRAEHRLPQRCHQHPQNVTDFKSPASVTLKFSAKILKMGVFLHKNFNQRKCNTVKNLIFLSQNLSEEKYCKKILQKNIACTNLSNLSYFVIPILFF